MVGPMPLLRPTRAFLPLLAFSVVLLHGAAAHAATSVVEAETMSLPSWGGTTVSEPSASGGRELLIWSNATATTTVTTTAARRLEVRVIAEIGELMAPMTGGLNVGEQKRLNALLAKVLER